MSRPISYSLYGIIPTRKRSLSDDMLHRVIHYIPGMVSPDILSLPEVSHIEVPQSEIMIEMTGPLNLDKEIQTDVNVNRNVQTRLNKWVVSCMRLFIGIIMIIGTNMDIIPLEYASGGFLIVFELIVCFVESK